MMDTKIKVRPLNEHPPMGEPTIVQFVFNGEPGGYAWTSGLSGIAFTRPGPYRPMTWGEVVDQHFDWANDPELDDIAPEGWVRLVPEREER